jgi:O-antigen ligase
MLDRLGIENRLQLAVTLCVVTVIVVTTLGNSGGFPWVFFTYRTTLILIAVFCAIGSRQADDRIPPLFLAGVVTVLGLMLIALWRIPGAHFEALYLWYKYTFFAAAFLGLSKYAKYQSAKWKGVIIGCIIGTGLAHLLPDLILRRSRFLGFSPNNPNYFATFLLIGLSCSIAIAVFASDPVRRIVAGCAGALILFGILKTASRGATLAAAAVLVIAAIRARGRIPRQVWLGVGLLVVLIAAIFSPFLMQKFTDTGQIDPYNYARTQIWRGALLVIEQHPILGVGFGQFLHISKRYTQPMDGVVARYLKRAQMAHNEYLQHIAEQGIPAALLLFSLLGYAVYLVWKRAGTTWPEYRVFPEAALLTATGVSLQALVDNCWTIPVTASSLIVLSLANPLPLRKKEAARPWPARQVALACVLLGLVYVFSTVIPGIALHYNEAGHQAYDANDLARAEILHLKAIQAAPDHWVFLDNLGMVYLQAAIDRNNPKLLEPARVYFTRAIAANPLALDPHIHMETLLLRTLSDDPAHNVDVYRDIIKFDTQMIDIDPYIPFPRRNIAGAYYNLGQPDIAFKEIETAIHYEPNYVPGYLQLATWYGDRGDAEAKARYASAAVAVITKYRNFKPTELYESALLGRPNGPVHP